MFKTVGASRAETEKPAREQAPCIRWTIFQSRRSPHQEPFGGISDGQVQMQLRSGPGKRTCTAAQSFLRACALIKSFPAQGSPRNSKTWNVPSSGYPANAQESNR